LVYMARHPIKTAEGLGHVVTNPGQTAEAIGRGIKDRWAAIAAGDEHSAHEAGKTFLDIASLFIAPEAQVAQTAKAVRLAEVGTNAARLAEVGTNAARLAEVGTNAATRSQQILADANVLVNAAERGSQNSLATIRASDTVITSAQRSEFLNGVGSAQRTAREAFLEREGITTFNPPEPFFLTNSGDEIAELIDVTIHAGHSPNDAIFVGVSKAAGIPARTAERRLTNFFNLSQGRPFNVDIRQVRR
jgi:hypothetical protein